MGNALVNPLETSIQIAWDYLARTGELGEPQVAARILMDTVERLIRHGENRSLKLSKNAIDAYKRFRSSGARS